MSDAGGKMKTNGNDHAFQQTEVQPYKDGNKTVNVMSVTGGLTKRELFSAMAMQGMIAGSQGLKITINQFAEQSVKLADALIAELNKEPEA